MHRAIGPFLHFYHVEMARLFQRENGPCVFLPRGWRVGFKTGFPQSLLVCRSCTTYRTGGYPDPLVGCIRLKRVVRGIQRCKGGGSDKRLPNTPDILMAIYGFLDHSVYDDVMFWGRLGSSPSLKGLKIAMHANGQKRRENMREK
jgi:hypothetical protein